MGKSLWQVHDSRPALFEGTLKEGSTHLSMHLCTERHQLLPQLLADLCRIGWQQ